MPSACSLSPFDPSSRRTAGRCSARRRTPRTPCRTPCCAPGVGSPGSRAEAPCAPGSTGSPPTPVSMRSPGDDGARRPGIRPPPAILGERLSDASRPEHELEEVLVRADGSLTPEAGYERREGLELAVLTSLQHLPPRQRAALILREALDFSASETAAALRDERRVGQQRPPARPQGRGRTPPRPEPTGPRARAGGRAPSQGRPAAPGRLGAGRRGQDHRAADRGRNARAAPRGVPWRR